MNRIKNINSQITTHKQPAFSQVGVKHPDDVVIVSCKRTALTKAYRGGFKDTKPEELLAHVFKTIIEETKIDPKIIEDIAVGNVLLPGGGAFLFRGAALMAGIPQETPILSVNRFCSSGLEAVSIIASKIKSGLIEVGIGAGCESMTQNDMSSSINVEKLSDAFIDHKVAEETLTPMGLCSEHLTKQCKLTREKLDQFAVESHRRAQKARDNGYFKNEIAPMKVKWINPKTKEEEERIIDQDDGIRDNANYDTFSKLKPSFTRDGFSTPGNSSQLTDGAGAVLLMKRSKAEQLGLQILGKFVSHQVVGLEPLMMGAGPLYAIPKVLETCKLRKEDIDIYEINEAFASQCTYCVDQLGLDYEKVNPKGGAIAIGHPMGATGARQVSTLIYELHRLKKKLGVISMCIGTGMGAAAVFEAEFQQINSFQ